MRPRVSVLLPATLGYDAARVALEAWDQQTWRDRLEILVLCPVAPVQPEPAVPAAGFRIVPVGDASLHAARAIGVREASGEYITLAEDHCLPDPRWAEEVVARLEEGWDGVGTALRPGNRVSRWAEASFLIGYGEWMWPVAGGPTPVLCGLNGTVRADLLKARGESLADELLIGSLLVQELRKQGARFYLENGTTMRHFDPPNASSAVSSLFALGLGFGAQRTNRWALPVRWLYGGAAPLVAALHTRRAVRHYARAGRAAGLSGTAPVLAAVLAMVWAAGEAVGAVLGIRRIEAYVSRAEIRPVTRAEVALPDSSPQAANAPAGSSPPGAR